MAHQTRLAGSRRPRLAAAAIALLSALAVAGCAYAPPPEAAYPPPGPEAGPPPGYAPQTAAGAAYPTQPSGYAAPGAYGAPQAYGGGPQAYGGGPEAYRGGPPGYGAPQAYGGGPPGYGGPAAGIPRDAFIAHWREVAMRKGRDPERAARMAARRFDRMDTDRDGILQLEERAAWRAAHGRYGASGQTWQEPPAPAYRQERRGGGRKLHACLAQPAGAPTEKIDLDQPGQSRPADTRVAERLRPRVPGGAARQEQTLRCLAPAPGARGLSEEIDMDNLTRRSLLRGSLGAVAAAGLARPYIANAAAKTASVWWTQGYVPEEDAAFRALVANYEKASGNKIDYSIVPYAPLRQKEVSAITSGVVPDLMEGGDPAFVPLHAWTDRLLDVSDVIETQRSNFGEAALQSAHCYNSVTKQRSFYGVPHKGGVIPFHFWRSLVEKAGYKLADLPDRWDAFLDFFKPVQTKLRAQGMRHVYAYGFEVSAVGDDPNNTFMAFLIAYGGRDLVTPDGKLHTDDPKNREAAIKAVVRLTTPYKEGFAPPAALNWNDADDNNAFHAKQVVIDFDGTLSTELALIHNKAQYDDIVTHGLPLDNDGKEMPSQMPTFQVAIPKGAKNVAVAKDFLKYLIQPKELNTFLKGGLGRWLPTMPELAKTDSWWLDASDPHRVAYVRQGIFGPTVPPYQVFNPAWAQVFAEHTFSVAEFDVMQNGAAPEQAVAKAFERIEAIFAKYPIAQA